MDLVLTIANYMKENVDDGILTDIGFKLLENNLESDLNILKEGISQKPLCRVCCHMCVVYNLLILWGGYITTVDVPEDLKNLDWHPIALMLEQQLPIYLSHLNDKYAQIFHDVKVQSFKKPIFGDVHHIPTHPDDLPKDFKAESCKTINEINGS